MRAMLLSFMMAVTLSSYSGAEPPAPAHPASSVPTTKVLAIGTREQTMTPEQRASIMPHEVRETVELYLGGKIDQWWFRQDGTGVVFLMNVTSVEEARTLLERLPLGQAKLMKFDYMPLGPLAPLRYLVSAQSH